MSDTAAHDPSPNHRLLAMIHLDEAEEHRLNSVAGTERTADARWAMAYHLDVAQVHATLAAAEPPPATIAMTGGEMRDEAEQRARFLGKYDTQQPPKEQP